MFEDLVETHSCKLYAAVASYQSRHLESSASNPPIHRYRDFGDNKRFEGPFDFCGEDELPGLLAKLRKIIAYGGKNRHRHVSVNRDA